MEVIGFHKFTLHQEDSQNSPENSDESPPSSRLHDTMLATSSTSSSSKTSRRGTKKKVVYVPIKDVEGSRLKAETNAPPADSWAWRKYGQKPIKGSPYPRGYYKCSSSKGCPARKQVERSRTDPTMVMVTYSSEHNHPWPASRNNNQHHRNTPSLATTEAHINITNEQLEEEEEDEKEEEEPPIQTGPCESESDQKFTSLEVGSTCGPFVTITNQYYGWFSDLDSTTTMFESPLMARDMDEESEVFSVKKDEESFFDDLGELPECTTVFKRREAERTEEHHHRSLASWCGTTG